MSSPAKTLLTVLAVAVLGVSASWLYARYEGYLAAAAEESLHWPSVEGLVTRSKLETYRKKVGAERNQVRYRVDVAYEYIVGDERYENDVVRFDQDNLSQTDKERLVSAHPVGRQVEVFYNPSNPGQSVLVRGSAP